MEISHICNDLIDLIKNGNNSLKDIREKTERIKSFCKIISSQEMKQEFIKSSYVADVIIQIIKMSIVSTQRASFRCQNFENVPYFFSFLAKNNIPLSKEEKDIQELIVLMIDIIIDHIPKADEESWTFWLKVFIEILKIPTFYNLFREDREDSNNTISYIKIDSLFTLVNNLMKFKKISRKDSYSDQRSLALIFFSTFLGESPYPPSPDIISSVFELSDSLSDMDISDYDFTNLLGILNELIALSPISFLINSTTPFHAPFNENILQRIYGKWNEYQAISSIRESSSAYLLLFITTMDALKYEIQQSVSDSWAKRILDVWSKYKNRDKIIKSSNDIPYLRADIEFLKRSRDPSISKCLLQYILPNNKLNQNSNVIWLFTAIGLYAPELVHIDDWIHVLGAINSFKIGDAVWRNQQSLPDFYGLISVMVDIIDSKTHWNNVFIFLIENQPSKDPISSFYTLISKIFSKQKIDTKIAHQYQHLLWKEKSNVAQFILERLKCIHTLIYYYGFSDTNSRVNCFNVLITLLDTKETLSNEYIKQLTLTISSIISSHPFPLTPVKPSTDKKKSIDQVCAKLKKQLEITTAKTKIESPLQTEELFMITPESSQITVDDNDSNFSEAGGNLLFSESYQDNQKNSNNDPNNGENGEKQFALCNFISKSLQSTLITNIFNRDVKFESNDCFLDLFLTSYLPNFFSPNTFFGNLVNSINENCTIETFPNFVKILLTVTDEIHGEDFQPFFEDIEEIFFDIAHQYIQTCEDKIKRFLDVCSSMSWDLLNNAAYEDYFNDLPLLAEFAVKCSLLASGTNDLFYECFQNFLSTSVWIPNLHLKISSNLLNLSLSEQQKEEIVNSLEDVVERVLQVLLVPVKERDVFIDQLFKVLKYDNSKPMDDLFRSISKYSITPSMKSGLLNIMQYNYGVSNQIFDCFWEDGSSSPFFVQDDYPTIRLQSIDTIVSILKLKDISIFNGVETISQKFEKDKFFKEFIIPYIEEMLEEIDWNNCKQTVFTAIKTLIQVAAEIPELTTKSLFIIFDSFTLHDFKIFPEQCINVLFSGLSTRIHFSFFLRQFIPMLTPQLDKLTDRLSTYPYELFFLDEVNVSSNEAKRMFCDKAAPYAMAFAIANSKQQMIEFFTSTLKKNKKEIIMENSLYICSYILNAINEAKSEEEVQMLTNLYKQLMNNNKFSSPIPLLSFVSMASDETISASYEQILEEKSYTDEFVNIRTFIFKLYTTIFKAHHELVQSYYLQQFSLYVSMLFQSHSKKFEENQTLYSDILALTVNLLEFVPPSESSILLIAISSNIPINFKMEMVGFVKNIEDICYHLGNHPCLEYFFDKFNESPKLINEILIFDFLKERQLKERTPCMEFERIAKTKRINQESIHFLLYNLNNEPESISQINLLSNDYKRIALNEIYNFAIKNPQTLALHLYSILFLNFIHIHPSPLVIGFELNLISLIFQKVLELARDINPSINRSALTALYIISNKPNLLKSVVNDELLTLQIIQYKDFAHPRKKVKKTDEDSPWICKFVCKYIEQMNEDDFCYAFQSLAAVSPEFCELLFPQLFIECFKGPLFNQIYNEFKLFSGDPKEYFNECKLFITGFNYLRYIIFKSPDKNLPDWHLKWLNKNIDFQRIMDVCIRIGDPYSAYQYAEFARESINMNEQPLNEIFTHLGVNELKYGLNQDLANPLSFADLHKQEGRLEKALDLYDNINNIKMMCDTLFDLHLYNLLGNMKTKLSDENIESLWRLRKWDISSEIMREMTSRTHSSNLFQVMQAIATNNEEAIVTKLNDFEQQFHFDLSSTVFTQLSHLLDASALEWFHALLFKDSSKLCSLFPQDIISIYRRNLKQLNQLSSQFYKITESANALHGVFFCILSNFENPPISLSSIPPKFLTNVITNSLENNEIESAQYFITLLRENQKSIPQYANFEQVRVLYQDNPHHAVTLLRQNFENILLKENQIDSEKRRNSFNINVEFARAAWSEHTNNLPSNEVYEQLELVIEKCEQNELMDLMADAEFSLARVYHRQHREICNFFTSTEYNTIVDIISYEKAYLTTKTTTTAKSAMKRTAKQDYNSYVSIINQYKELFSLTIVNAIKNYMKVLIHTDKYDLECSYSITGIWFDYSYTKYKPFVQEIPDLIPTMTELFIDIDANKFLSLFYQLSARIDTKGEITSTQNEEYNTSFQNFLCQMVTDICQKSPSECFPILFAFERNNIQNSKLEAITDLISSIVSISDELNERWHQTKILLERYLLLATAPQMNTRVNSLSRLNQDLIKCTKENMPYSTIITNSNEVGIDHFDDKVIVLNGINRPIKIKILGTDGNTYNQIVKGNKDDLRQDAVMQQLFVLSSKLLSRKNPNLSIRSYKVVPLSSKAGVIEFVENSISIQDYLYRKVDKKQYDGALTRYYTKGESLPISNVYKDFNDMSTNYHNDLKKNESSKRKLINFFKDLRSKMKPAFHFFFIERFPNPSDWFVSRLRYCRHTATNSIVGHILGIGDRHLNNILIDKKTGEIIHIDLGIAFEQGKALPIMEIVPFRLTNEIIDGMGWMGKDGVFRKTCDETLLVLRNNSEYLLTILKVLMSDPLYTWLSMPKTYRERTQGLQLTPLKLGNSESGNSNSKFAESVIFKCQRKLEGRETGEILSVEGQVSKLINDATSDDNLALMFSGWKPFL